MSVLIVVCDVLVWFFLVGGVVAHHRVGRRALGNALLWGAAVLVLVLLGATALSVRNAVEPSGWHGLATAWCSLVWLGPFVDILVYSLVWPVAVTIRHGRKPKAPPVAEGR
ncbi:hypothetical protein ACSMX9_06300 [Streptomyces sp. LE64]|uniref:hypothetical protein n=1 Tax=Streptomyces sp. LE64 TaxID=3448653 RepID=UPI00404391C5